MTSYLRAAARLLRLAWTLGKGWCWVRFEFPALSAPQREARVSQWAHQMLSALGVSLHTVRPLNARGPALLVANHISWVDILALMAIGPCRFVSKAQVHHWPLVGTMAAGAGTLFIERESPRDAMRVMHQLAQVLGEGGTVAVFPEGTTSTGETVMPFHANLFQAAVAAKAPVQTLALAYFDAHDQPCSAQVAFVGDDNLLHSLRYLLLAKGLSVKVGVGPLSSEAGYNRRQWAQWAHEQVQALHTQLLQPNDAKAVK